MVPRHQPFLYAPSNPALDAVETGYRFFITHSEFSTIYPPSPSSCSGSRTG